MSLDLTAPDAIAIPQDGMMGGELLEANGVDDTEGLGIYDNAGADDPSSQPETPPAGPAPIDEAKRWQNQYRDAQIQLRRVQAQAQRQLAEAQAKAQLPPEVQQLQQLMQYPGAKARLAEFLGTLAQDPNFDPGQPAAEIRDAGLREEFEQIKPLLSEFQELTEALRYERAETQVNQIHEDLQQSYPDAFAARPDLFQEIARTTLERYGDDPTPEHIRAVSYELILKAMPSATQRAAGQIARAMSQQPPGSRLVTGSAAKAAAPAPPTKDYAKMSWREIEASGFGDIDIFAPA